MAAMQQALLATGAAAGGGGSTHRFWRIYVTATNGSAYVSISEVELRAAIGGADQTGGGTASESSYFFPEAGNRAFNNDGTFTQWSSGGGGMPEWVKYDFGAGQAKSIVEFTVRARGDGNAATMSPKDFKLQWSDDDSSYTDAIVVTNQTGWSAGETRTFS